MAGPDDADNGKIGTRDVFSLRDRGSTPRRATNTQTPFIMEKIEKEIKVTRYVAFDGSEFETEAECRHYEGSAFGELVQQLKGCMLAQIEASNRERIIVLVPKTRHDIFVLGQILKMAGSDEPCADVYGHLTQLTVTLDCNTVAEAHVTNIEDYIHRMSNGHYAVVSTIKDAEKR